MTIFEAIFLGFVQGVTEWFPISSSGHIFLIENFLQRTPSLELSIWLHAASLLAVILYFHKKIFNLIRGFFSFISGAYTNTDGIFASKIVVATMVSAPVAIVLERVGIFESLTITIVASTLAITGLLIIISEYFSRNTLQAQQFTWTIAVTLGLVQGLAVMPGISRAGLTIAFLLFVGVRRVEAVTISFLLAVPTILGAVFFAFSDFSIVSLSFTNPVLLTAFIFAFLSSLAGIHFMRNWIQTVWIWFAPYCFILALMVLLL